MLVLKTENSFRQLSSYYGDDECWGIACGEDIDEIIIYADGSGPYVSPYDNDVGPDDNGGGNGGDGGDDDGGGGLGWDPTPQCGAGRYYDYIFETCLLICPPGFEDYGSGCIRVDCDTNKVDLKKAFPNTSDATLQEITNHINTYGKNFGIKTKELLQHFLAQAGHESTSVTTGIEFGAFEENLNYRISKLGVSSWNTYFYPVTDTIATPNKENPDDYRRSEGSDFVDVEKFANYVYDDDNRSDSYKLGNTQVGDGYKFRGRGIFQLTGRSNYSTFNNFYRQNYDNTKNLLTNPGLLASDKKIAVISALWYFKNRVIDKLPNGINTNTSVKKVTKKVNGNGNKGLTHRKELHTKAKENVNCL